MVKLIAYSFGGFIAGTLCVVAIIAVFPRIPIEASFVLGMIGGGGGLFGGIMLGTSK